MLLKECASAVAEPLSLIFVKSFDTGTLPEDWRKAHIVPILKKGDRTDKANYCPVSLTSVPCKLMESMIKDKVMSFMQENSVFSTAEHGFLPGRLFLTNLLKSLENWTKALDDGYGIDIIYIDYRNDI